MFLMSCRMENLKSMCEGYFKTGICFLNYINGKLSPAIFIDDAGLYVLVPKIAAFFNISCECGVSIFFYSILLVPAIIGSIGFCLLENTWKKRVIALLGIFFLARFIRNELGDVYISYFSVTVLLIPWYLYFIKKDNYKFAFWLFNICAGFVIGFFNYIRAYSGLGVILFVGVLYLFNKKISVKTKIIMILMLSIGFLVPSYYFNSLHKQSLMFYKKQNIESELVDTMDHPFWHNIYLGLGFLQWHNVDNIGCSDENSYKKVLELRPDFFSGSDNFKSDITAHRKEYESALKGEVLKVCSEKFQFFLVTIFAKIGVLFLYFLIAAFFGVLFFALAPQLFLSDFAFFVAASFYASFPLIVFPSPEYALGFISCSVLWSITRVNYGLNFFYDRFLICAVHGRNKCVRHFFIGGSDEKLV